MKYSSAFMGLLLTGFVTLAAPMAARAELDTEPVPNVMTLPDVYPDNWLFVHDINFFSLLDGRVILLDLAAENHNYKGAIGAAQFASFIEAETRPELYVAETFYSRGTRGERFILAVHAGTESMS